MLADRILAPGAQMSTQEPTLDATVGDSHSRWSSVSVAATVMTIGSLQKQCILACQEESGGGGGGGGVTEAAHV